MHKDTQMGPALEAYVVSFSRSPLLIDLDSASCCFLAVCLVLNTCDSSLEPFCVCVRVCSRCSATHLRRMNIPSPLPQEIKPDIKRVPGKSGGLREKVGVDGRSAGLRTHPELDICLMKAIVFCAGKCCCRTPRSV